MNRQVDIKALVSHIVRGDGADKCRICLGDTTEGQVYLGDTVMMDGDKPITLSELLETITGVEVSLEEDLPSTICQPCFEEATRAAAFRDLCKQADHHWHETLVLLEGLPSSEDVSDSKSIYAILHDGQLSLIDNKTDVKADKHRASPRKYSKKKGAKMKESCTCPDCGKTFVYAQQLYNHLMESPDHKRACYICADIMFREELIFHLKKVHNTIPFVCKRCPALLQSLKLLTKHKLKFHAPGSHQCGECGRTFNSLHAYHGHISAHNSKNCPACDKLFRNHRCYLHHVNICCKTDREPEKVKNKVLYTVSNKDDKKVKVGTRGSTDTECFCDYCGKKYAGKRFVSAHIQIVHMKNTHRPCPFCGIMYASAHMSLHLKKHQEAKVHTCEHCGVTLKTKLGHLQHLRLHTGEKPYACKYCDETFSASSRRSEHVRNVHRKIQQEDLKHACNLCPARFRLPYRLKQHLSTVHGEGKDKKLPFECPDCHIMFGTCRGLIHHSRKHQTFSLKTMMKEQRDKRKQAEEVDG